MAASVAQRARRLGAVPLFAGVSKRSLQEIARCAAEVDARAGQVLVQPNQVGSGMFVIEDGKVEVSTRGRRLELGPGDFFGELALLTKNSRRTARVRAKTDVRCFAISRVDFRRLLEGDTKLAIAVLEGVAERLERATS